MWIVCTADNSHEMLSFIFSEKKEEEEEKKKKKHLVMHLSLKLFLI